MIAITRFRVSAATEDSFRELGRAATDFYLTRPGCLSSELVRNVDEPDLWALVSRWADVGSYRRAYGGYDAKIILTPLLLLAIDEPGGFETPEAAGINRPRSN